MKLLTKEIEAELQKFPLYSQENEGDNAIVVCKFFAPVGGFTWYVTEAERVSTDYHFFGLVVNNYGEREFGYFLLSELESIKLPMGLFIERDIYFSKCTIKDL